MRSALLILLLVASAARGQGQVLLPPGALSAKTGDWVTYRLDGGGGRVSYWRMAVVGQERDDKGREALWIEMELGAQRELLAPMVQLRMLVARDLGMSAEGVSRLLLAQGFERPREVSPEAIAALFARLPVAKTGAGPHAPRLRVRTGSWMRLMTAAGALSAQPMELLIEGTVLERLWMSRAVPVLGLAKLELPALGQTMEVADHGTDARPRMASPAPEAPPIQLER